MDILYGPLPNVTFFYTSDIVYILSIQNTNKQTNNNNKNQFPSGGKIKLKVEVESFCNKQTHRLISGVACQIYSCMVDVDPWLELGVKLNQEWGW